jgi:hypothetical protein
LLLLPPLPHLLLVLRLLVWLVGLLVLLLLVWLVVWLVPQNPYFFLKFF